jgi:hypothetical protein
MKKSQDEGNPNKNLMLLKDSSERMLTIQKAQFELQRKMLDLAFSGIFLLFSIGGMIKVMVEKLGSGFAYVGRMIANIFNEAGRARAEKIYQTSSEGLDKELSIYKDMFSTSTDGIIQGFKDLKAEFLDGKGLLATVSHELDGLGKGSGQAATQISKFTNVLKIADEYSKKIDALKADKPGKRHFGGPFEKFHYGGVIKQGTEALLMSPNPTSVLSPADTRQAVRGGSEKGDVNIHFHAPVYGIPKFKEMVKDTVMQYASGIR